jgi:hypothetical protein
MGTWFQWIADLDATDDEAPHLARTITARLAEQQIVLPDVVEGAAYSDAGHLPGPRWADAVAEPEPWMPHGMRIVAQREVFWGGQGGFEWAECPRCGHRTSADAHRLLDAVEPWLRGDPATHPCPGCGSAIPLTDWRWDEDYFAFATFGLWFWDWPELGPLVPGIVRDAVGNHRLVYGQGKL